MADLMPAVRGVVKAAINCNPVTGAVLTVMEEYAQEANERAAAKAEQFLHARVDMLGERIDVECVRTDQFADL